MHRVRQWARALPRDPAAFLLYAGACLAFFAPVLLRGQNLLIDADHVATYLRTVTLANWMAQGIIPLWDPQSFSGVSYVDTIPATHFVNGIAFMMAFFGNALGYNLFVALLVLAGCYGTYLVCRRTLGLGVGLSFGAGMTAGFSPYLGPTYSAIFAIMPFISFYFISMAKLLEEKSLARVVRHALAALVPYCLCFYTQETRYVEYIFYSSLLFFAFAVALAPAKGPLLRNGLVFAGVIFAGTVLLAAPLLWPAIQTTAGQQRLGSGLNLPPIFLMHKSPRALFPMMNLLLGNLFPVNVSVFQDGLRLKLMGDYLTFYFEFVHILFYASVIIAAAIYRRLSHLEKCIFWTALASKLLSCAPYYIPGLQFVWTLMFKTGRFGLSNENALFYCILLVFLVLARVLAPEFKLEGRARGLVKGLAWFQIVLCALAFAGVAVAALHPQLLTILAPARARERGLGFLQAVIDAFLSRSPCLLASFLLLGLQLGFFLRRALHGRLSRAGRIMFLGLLVLTPPILSRASWPFNRQPERASLGTPDRRFLASLSVLDRAGSVDFTYWDDLPEKQRKKIISLYSPESLKWAIRAFRPGAMIIIQHFIPFNVFQYFQRMYRDDPYIRNYGIEDRIYFAPQDNNLFHLLGINYIFSELDVFSAPFKKLGQYGKYFIYKNAKAFPRFYLAERVTWVPAADGLLDRIAAMPYQELRGRALAVDPSIAGEAHSSFQPRAGRLELVSYGPNEVLFKTRSPTEQFLVLTDTFDPKWRAYVDEAGTRVYETNHLFRGVRVPPGEHAVRFAYSSFAGKALALVAVLSAALLIWLRAVLSGA